MEIAMLGEQLSAQEAKKYGLVNFVVAEADLAGQTEKLARRLADGPTRALGNIKKLMHTSMENNWEGQLQLEAEAFVDNVMSADFSEGLTAFMERRPTKFTGK
jgi:2-(1,2-epoxy-1,2-dihydrophenyl)acetyl-CoA isomerase